MAAKSTPRATCGSACSPLRKASSRSALLFTWLLPGACLALPPGVNALLEANPPPDGVVFEIVEGREDALTRLLPEVREAIVRLRSAHPDIELAVVSHGGEQFALQQRHSDSYADIHRQTRDIVSDGVPLHVCGAHAGWYGVTAEDFPDYVDVSPSGPAQINQYRELGYHLIRVESDD